MKYSNSTRKLIRLCILILGLAVAAILWQPPLTINPISDCNIFPVCDTSGKIISCDTTNGILTFKGIFGDDPDAYTNCNLEFKQNINIRRFDNLTFDFKTGSSILNVFLTVPIPHYSDSMDIGTHLFYLSESPLKLDTSWNIPINSMKIPSWWYSMNKQISPEKAIGDPTHASSIILSSHSIEARKGVFEISLKRITFSSSPLKIILPIGVAILLIILIENVTRRKPESATSFQVSPADLPDSTEKQLFETLAIQYKESTCTAENIGNVIGITSASVSRIVQMKTGMGFSAYLRQLRIESAAESLNSRPDLDIKAIAFAVGFTNAAAFSRAFREVKGVSPSEFREKQ